MDRLLESLVRRFVAPFFEATASGVAPVRVRSGNIIIENACLNREAIEMLWLHSESGLPPPAVLALGCDRAR